jgi:DNA repair protein RadA
MAKQKAMKIEDIPGVGPTTTKKLKEAGYNDFMGLALINPSALAEQVEIGEPTARKIINTVRSKLKMTFISGIDVLEKEKDIGQITTGSKALDALIGGGVETQAITEGFGKFGVSKTQIAFQLAVNVQFPKDKGGLGAQVIFIDTEGTFKPMRVMQIAKAKGLDPNEVLKNIKVGRAYSSDHQLLLVEKIPEIIEKEKLNVKLIIIDSLTGLFRSDYVGRGTLAERQQKLNVLMHTLQRLSDRYNAAIYVTNQVMARPDTFFGDPTQPIGGHVVGHAATYRLYLRKAKGDKRIARLIDSPNLPDGETVFRITESGVEDAE